MNSKRVFFAMIGVCCLLGLSVLGVLFMGDKILRKQSVKLVELKLEDKLLDEQQTSLAQANKDIKQYEDLEQIAKAVVPQDKDQARAVREIVGLAKKSDISISNISFPSSSLGAQPTQTKSSDDSAESSKTSSASATSTLITQAKPVEGVSGVYSLEMTITPDSEKKVTYYQLLDFLGRLENNRRTAQVTSVKILPITSDAKNPYISFTLTINIFLKP